MNDQLELLMTYQLRIARKCVERIRMISDLKSDRRTLIDCINMLRMFDWWTSNIDNISRHIDYKTKPDDRIRKFISELDTYYFIDEIKLCLDSIDVIVGIYNKKHG